MAYESHWLPGFNFNVEEWDAGDTYESYNDIANWSYADLPKVFRLDTSARSFVVKTIRHLQNALARRTIR
jgi:indolepyruvate decarboxylase